MPLATKFIIFIDSIKNINQRSAESRFCLLFRYNSGAMSKTSKILIVVGFLVLMGYIVYSSLGLSKFRCEVCMEFRGGTACRTALGSTREEAIRTAADNACAQLTSGMTDSMSCTQTPPKSINCKER